MKLTINPVKIARNLIIIVLGLSILSLIVTIVRALTGHGRLFGFGSFFNAGTESSLPTWFSIMLLMTCSVLLWIIAIAEKEKRNRFARHWRYLSYIFLYLSIDEGCMVHERIGDLASPLFQGSSLAMLGWVAPFGIIVLVFGISFIPFIRSLPTHITRLFILSAILYVGGAAVLEGLNGIWRSSHSDYSLVSAIETSLEEMLEMSGVVLFMYSLTSYIMKYIDDFAITFENIEAVQPDTVSYQAPDNAYTRPAE